MKLNSDSLHKTITFDSYEGVNYKAYRFVAILDAATVVALGFDAEAKHRQNYLYLPVGAPDSYRAYSYAKLIDADNNVLYMGIPWVKPDSIKENANPTTYITVRGATTNQLSSLRSMMTASGIEDFTFDAI